MIRRDLSIWALIRNRVLAGLFLVVPMVISLWIGYFLFNQLTQWSVALITGVFKSLADMNFRGVGFLRIFSSLVDDMWFLTLVRVFSLIAIVVLLFLIGELATWTFGRRVISITEWVLLKVPMLNSIYATTRQIGEALWSPGGGMFRRVVLLEYPRKELWAIGFVTNENKSSWEVGEKTGEDLISVFLPTTPNPTSGYLLFIPRRDCVFLDMDVTEGMRLVISGGAVQPATKGKEQPPNSEGVSNERADRQPDEGTRS